jgi:hypothetical protein
MAMCRSIPDPEPLTEKTRGKVFLASGKHVFQAWAPAYDWGPLLNTINDIPVGSDESQRIGGSVAPRYIDLRVRADIVGMSPAIISSPLDMGSQVFTVWIIHDKQPNGGPSPSISDIFTATNPTAGGTYGASECWQLAPNVDTSRFEILYKVNIDVQGGPGPDDGGNVTWRMDRYGVHHAVIPIDHVISRYSPGSNFPRTGALYIVSGVSRCYEKGFVYYNLDWSTRVFFEDG